MARARLVVAAAVVLGACGNDPLAPSDVLGNPWRLVTLQPAGAAAIVVDDPSRYTVQFGDDGRLAVRSDCNSCGGSYALTDSSLDVGALACTRAFCGDASLDGRYTAVLQATRSVGVRGNEMTIVSSTGTLQFRR